MFHHAVELFLWLLLAFALGAILGCIVRAAFGRGKEEMEYRLTGPRLSDAYKAEGGKGTPVGRALGLMGSGEAPAAAKTAAMGMASATAAAAGSAAQAAPAGTTDAGKTATDTKKEQTADVEKTQEEEAAGAGKESGPEKAEGAVSDEAAAKETDTAEKPAQEAEPTESAEAQGLMGGGMDAGAGDKAKWEVPVFGLEKPTAGEPDNLQLISGIGPKLEKLLHELGIYYFAQIARWTKKDIAAVDDKLKFKGRIERDEWVRQAKLLAEGKMEQFEREYGTGGLKDKSGKTRSGTRTRKKK